MLRVIHGITYFKGGCARNRDRKAKPKLDEMLTREQVLTSFPV